MQAELLETLVFHGATYPKHSKLQVMKFTYDAQTDSFSVVLITNDGALIEGPVDRVLLTGDILPKEDKVNE